MGRMDSDQIVRGAGMSNSPRETHYYNNVSANRSRARASVRHEPRSGLIALLTVAGLFASPAAIAQSVGETIEAARADLTKTIANIGSKSDKTAIAELKKRAPDYVVGEFFYGYGNNYAGVNVSNLDVFLHSLRKYAPEAKVIVLVSKTDQPHVAKLQALFDIHAVLVQPVGEAAISEALQA